MLLASVIGRMLGLHGDQSAFAAIALAPIFFWELSVGLWMTFKGFDPSAPILSGESATGGSRSTSSAPSQAPAATELGTASPP